LLLGHADVLNADTVAAIHDPLPRLRVALWNVDPAFEANNVARTRSRMEVVDWTFVSTGLPVLHETFGAATLLAFLANAAAPAIERGRNFEKARLP
jgi:hypothetical protein